jgi:hypothetical protein
MTKKSTYYILLPTPSARRLEIDRRIVIEAHCQPSGVSKHEFPVPKGEIVWFFDFAFDEFELNNPNVDDGGVDYTCYVEYRNTNGSRYEKIDFDWKTLDREDIL